MAHRLPTFVFCRTAALALTGILFLASCKAPPPPPFNPDDPAIRAAIESRLQTMFEGAAAVDAGKVLESAEGPGELTFLTGDTLLRGIDTIRARFNETYAGLARQDQTVVEKQVRVLSPDVVLVMAVAEGTYTDKAGWTSEPVGIGLTLVFVRENGLWQVRHAHQSIVR